MPKLCEVKTKLGSIFQGCALGCVRVDLAEPEVLYGLKCGITLAANASTVSL